MLICETNNQRDYGGASHAPVVVASWEEAEKVLMEKFPGRTVAGATAQDRVLELQRLLDRTCAVTFQII
jgi:hypothetical protein